VSAPAAPLPRLVLASSSPRRAELLGRLGLTPRIRPAHLDETPLPGETPELMVVRLATSKAAAAAAVPSDPGHDDGPGTVTPLLEGPDGEVAAEEVVLAADTEVVLDGRTLGKPADRRDAAAMLAALSGRSHAVMTGVAVQRGPHRVHEVVTTTVTFRRLTDVEIAWYLDTGEPHDKAGAYALQGAGAALVERVDGSDTNVIGLPLAETVALLRQVGFDPLRPDGPGGR
jgi:septum formation protein